METVLVTGGCGFIGSHIVDELLKQDYEVVVVDNMRTGHIENIQADKVILYENSILEEVFDDIVKLHKPRFIIHQAAQVSVSESVANMELDEEINIRGSIKVIDSARKHGVEKIIFASSAAVYGTPEYLPVDINHRIDPLSPYGVSKFSVECYLKMAEKLYGLKFAILRYANVYGPRQDAHGEGGVVSIFSDLISSNQVPTIDGDGTQTRDFIYVTDVAKANVAAMAKGDNTVLNVSTGEKTSINELFDVMSELANFEKKANYGPVRQGDIKHSTLSNTETMMELRWEPSVKLRDGLKETMESLRK